MSFLTGFNVHPAADDTTVTVDTDIGAWDTAAATAFYTTSAFDLTGGFFIAPVAGSYQVNVQLAGAKPILCVNSTPVLTTSYVATNAINSTVYLAATDVVTIRPYASGNMVKSFTGEIASWWAMALEDTLLQRYPAITEVQSQTFTYAEDTSGTPDIIVCNPGGSVPLVEGSCVECKVANAPLTTTPTLAVSGAAATPIKIKGNIDPPVGSIVAGGIYRFCYDGTNYQLENPTQLGGSVSVSSITQGDGGIYINNTDPVNPIIGGNIFSTVATQDIPAGYLSVLTNDPLNGGFGTYKGANLPFSAGVCSTSQDPASTAAQSNVNAIVTDPGVTAYLAGYYVRQATFGSTVFSPTGNNNTHAFISATPTNTVTPTWLWAYADTTAAAISTATAAAFSGTDVYFGISVSSGTASIDGHSYGVGCHILRYEGSSGTYVSSTQVAAVGSILKLMVHDATGDIIVFLSAVPTTTSIFGSAVTQLASNTFCLSRCTSAYALVWNVPASGSTNILWTGTTATIDQATGDTYIAGYFNSGGTLQFDAATITQSTGTAKAMAARFDSAGTCQWLEKDTSVSAALSRFTMSCFGNNRVYLAGYCSNNNFTFGGTTVNNTSNAISFLFRATTAGVTDFSSNLGGTATIDIVKGLCVDSSENMYIATTVNALGVSQGIAKMNNTGTIVYTARTFQVSSYAAIDILTADNRIVLACNGFGAGTAPPYSFNARAPDLLQSAGIAMIFTTRPGMLYTYATQYAYMNTTDVTATNQTKTLISGTFTVPDTLTVGTIYYYSLMNNTIIPGPLPSYNATASGNAPNYIFLGYAVGTHTLLFAPSPASFSFISQ